MKQGQGADEPLKTPPCFAVSWRDQGRIKIILSSGCILAPRNPRTHPPRHKTTRRRRWSCQIRAEMQSTRQLNISHVGWACSDRSRLCAPPQPTRQLNSRQIGEVESFHYADSACAFILRVGTTSSLAQEVAHNGVKVVLGICI